MNKAVFNRLMRFIQPYRRYLLVSLAFATGNVALTLYAPILVGRAIDLIIGPGNVDFPGIARIHRRYPSRRYHRPRHHRH